MEYMQQIIKYQKGSTFEETIKRKASNREKWSIARNQSQD